MGKTEGSFTCATATANVVPSVSVTEPVTQLQSPFLSQVDFIYVAALTHSQGSRQYLAQNLGFSIDTFLIPSFAVITEKEGGYWG